MLYFRSTKSGCHITSPTSNARKSTTHRVLPFHCWNERAKTNHHLLPGDESPGLPDTTIQMGRISRIYPAQLCSPAIDGRGSVARPASRPVMAGNFASNLPPGDESPGYSTTPHEWGFGTLFEAGFIRRDYVARPLMAGECANCSSDAWPGIRPPYFAHHARSAAPFPTPYSLKPTACSQSFRIHEEQSPEFQRSEGKHGRRTRRKPRWTR